MNSRKLQALRNLAERPGTEAEGQLAREMLDKLDAKRFADKPADEVAAWKLLDDLFSNAIGTSEFIDGLKRWAERDIPPEWTCACGRTLRAGDRCEDAARHSAIQAQILENFKRGDRVYYNFHAYTKNCPGFVAAHIKSRRLNGTYPWAWISVKFDHLKSARQVPIYSEGKLCLTKEPIGDLI